MKLREFIASLLSDVAYGVHQEAQAMLDHARKCEDYALDLPIGGENLQVEGASNLPNETMASQSFRFKTSGILEVDDDGDLSILLKNRSFFRQSVPIEIEVDFAAIDSLESLNQARDAANEVNRQHHIPNHKRKVAIQQHQRNSPSEEKDNG